MKALGNTAYVALYECWLLFIIIHTSGVEASMQDCKKWETRIKLTSCPGAWSTAGHCEPHWEERQTSQTPWSHPVSRSSLKLGCRSQRPSRNGCGTENVLEKMQSMYIHGIETKDSFISELYCSIERPAKLVNKSGLTPTPPW